MNGEVMIMAALEVDPSMEALWGSGRGTLSGAVQTLQSSDADFSLGCVYMSVTGADGKYNDDPNTINIAAACPVTSELSTQFSAPLLSSFAAVYFTLSLEPLCPTEIESTCPRPVTSPVPASALQPSVTSKVNAFSTTRHAVVTIQTFKNHFTGPMLYMFTRYYQRLGYAVIVFDRFAAHRSVFKELMSGTPSNDLPSVHYYGFTVFEKMFPHIYNASYHAEQSEGFLHFHHFEPKKGERKYVKEEPIDYIIFVPFYKCECGHTIKYCGVCFDDMNVFEGRETQNQNSDKRKTYMQARQLHSEYDTMFYIDRDELLYCPSGGQEGPSLASAAMTLDEQARIQHDVIDHYVNQGFERLSFQRYAYAARLPAGFNESLSEKARASVMDRHLPECLQEGYAARNMTALWTCWGVHFERQKQFKSGDIRLGKVCPFVGLHEPCLRCPCNKQLVTWKKSNLKGSACHFMHLNSVHVKAWMNPKKWQDSINDANFPQLEMWGHDEQGTTAG
eukprot:CAMPEP_0114470220 /NCGR_PEP_ID=MMETSP0104-20121206/11142_1 /TAXON_ID=37642 ORGANISM="Paraphysomonas imperforata, Strain PA2" /NCGR_SAMPLE_ID=MMETSP0104 /ASSEMBLY_ACC=CAM_ASM_000202 /LENGTH=504 /DNA_ID=CAMNT_0001643943 /DNA_START=325 /DNA_END=1841 /DNA_ORIENTATION=-